MNSRSEVAKLILNGKAKLSFGEKVRLLLAKNREDVISEIIEVRVNQFYKVQRDISKSELDSDVLNGTIALRSNAVLALKEDKVVRRVFELN